MPRKCAFSSKKQTKVSVSVPVPVPVPSITESLMGQIVERAEPIISKWDEDRSTYSKITSLFYENHHEATEFINQVNDLHKAMHTLVTNKSTSLMLGRAQKLMQIAMKRLQKELYQILAKNKANLDHESISTRLSTSSHSAPTSARSSTSSYDSEDEIRAAEKSIIDTENASAASMDDLVLIAQCMISSGYGRECVHTYKSMRKSIVDQGVNKLIVKESDSKIHKVEREVLDLKIKNWLDTINIAIQTLFKGERILCDHVFSTATDSVRELCFNEITKDGATILFEFPQKIIKNYKNHPEKIFRALDMYTAIASNWSDIESIFSSESSSPITNLALNSTIKLGNSVRTALTDFEASIKKDSSKDVDANTRVHSSTKNVMNFLSRLSNNNVLEDILFDYSTSSLIISDSINLAAARFARMILVLLCKLDVKAKLYKDVSHSYLFLANNLQYIITKVHTSNLKNHLDDHWISQHEAKVKTYATNYERLGWSHVIESLHANGDVKEKLKKFNVMFEEARKKQSVCVVEDSMLRDEIKLSIANKVLPLYGEFNGREGNFVDIVRFAPDDLGHALSDLFFEI